MKAGIELNWKEYYIETDEYQFSLFTKQWYDDKKTGEKKFNRKYIGHYTDLENCLRRMIRLESTKHGDMELKEYINLWKFLKTELMSDLSEELSVLTI